MAEYINRARVLMYINDIQLTVSDPKKPTILPRDLCEWIFDGISTMPTIEVSTEGVAENATTTDCISRQAAIEALTGWETEPLDEDIVQALESLPTVEIVYCKDCRYAQDDIFHLFCELKCHKVMMDDYCSDGERKE